MCASVSLRSALERGGRALTVARRSHYSNLLCFGNDWTRALRCIPKGTEFLPTHAFATQNQRVSNQANSFAIYAHMPPDREREKQTTQNSGSGLRALFLPTHAFATLLEREANHTELWVWPPRSLRSIHLSHSHHHNYTETSGLLALSTQSQNLSHRSALTLG